MYLRSISEELHSNRTKRWALYGLGYSALTILYRTLVSQTPIVDYLKKWNETDDITQSTMISEFFGNLVAGPFIFAFASIIVGLLIKSRK